MSPDSEQVPLASSSERNSKNGVKLFLKKGIETLLEADFLCAPCYYLTENREGVGNALKVTIVLPSSQIVSHSKKLEESKHFHV